MLPLGNRPEQALENYSSTPVLRQMLTKQDAACMAQQCPHEQPEQTTQDPVTDAAVCLAQMSTPVRYPQVGKKICMSTHNGNGQDSFGII